MATAENSTKRAALHLLSRGLATYAEVAELSGTSRQLVRYWAREAPAEARQRYLKSQWNKAIQQAKDGCDG